MISFNQSEGLKSYIEKNTKLRTEAKIEFENFFKQMNNSIFGKMMENVRKYRAIKPVTTERRNHLVSEPKYYTTKIFTENLFAIEMEKTLITMNKNVYLELPILDL